MQTTVSHQGTLSTSELHFCLKNGLKFYFYLDLLQINRSKLTEVFIHLPFIGVPDRLSHNNLAFLRKQKMYF